MKPYPALLAELLSEELSSLRQQKALTQEAMAEQLRISSRAYSDLERGRYAASAPTLLFLFSMLDAEAQGALVQQFMDRVQALEGTDAAQTLSKYMICCTDSVSLQPTPHFSIFPTRSILPRSTRIGW